jgi:hypothetical protein
MEVKAQNVIDYLLAQNQQLVAEIAFLRAALGGDDVSEEEDEQKVEKED